MLCLHECLRAIVVGCVDIEDIGGGFLHLRQDGGEVLRLARNKAFIDTDGAAHGFPLLLEEVGGLHAVVGVLVDDGDAADAAVALGRFREADSLKALAHGNGEYVFAHAGQVCVGSGNADEDHTGLVKDGSRGHRTGGAVARQRRSDGIVRDDLVCKVDCFVRVALIVAELDGEVRAVGGVELVERKLRAVADLDAVLHVVARQGAEHGKLGLAVIFDAALIAFGIGGRGFRFSCGGFGLCGVGGGICRGCGVVCGLGCAACKQAAHERKAQDQRDHLFHCFCYTPSFLH